MPPLPSFGAASSSTAGAGNDGVPFEDAVGLLWYALRFRSWPTSPLSALHPSGGGGGGVDGPGMEEVQFEKREEKEEEEKDVEAARKTAMGSGARRFGAGAQGSDEVAVSASGPPSLSLYPKSPGNFEERTVALSGASYAADEEASAAMEEAIKSFDKWGAVRWVVLAAQAYALTGVLHTANALHRFIAQNLFHHRYRGDARAMCQAYAAKYDQLCEAYATQAAKAAAETAETAVPVSLSTAASSSMAGARPARLPATSGVQPLPALSSTSPRMAAAVASTADSIMVPLPLPATLGVPDSAVRTSASTVTVTAAHGGEGASSKGEVSDVGAHPYAPVAVSSSATSAEGGDGAARHDLALSTSIHAAVHSLEQALGQGSSAGGVDEGETERGTDTVTATDARVVAMSHPELPQLDGTTTVPTNTTVPSWPQQQRLPSATISPRPQQRAAVVALRTPDPFDAPWHALWCSLPTLQARARLLQLRYATPLPLEDVSALLEQLFLLEGADDFLTPVHPNTMMEFTGVRAGPYSSIVLAPLSFTEVRRYIADSHRQYRRAVAAAEHAASVQRSDEPSTTTITPSSSSSVVAGGIASDGRGNAAPAASTLSAKAETRGHRRSHGASSATASTGTSAVTRGGHEKDVCAWVDGASSNDRRVLTLAELERSVWHITANCAVFNAPESRYPRTARNFAAACIAVMVRYCAKQLADSGMT